MFNKTLFFFLLALLYINNILAQQTVSTSGLTINNTAGSISYTIGQIDYITAGNAFTMTQGVQQVFVKSALTYIATIDKSITLSVWPNPIIDKLFIKIAGNTNAGFSYQLFSIEGQLMETKKILGNYTTIDTHTYSVGVYIISISYANNPSLRFKIIKK